MTTLALTTIISGLQTGADQAGLRVARALGLRTGGWVPKGCRTRSGPMPELAALYGCQEHSSPQYAPRTILNVKRADATAWFGSKQSAGYVCTRKAVKREQGWRPGYPYIEIDVFAEAFDREGVTAFFLAWLATAGVRILNVAGHSEDTHPGIGERVEAFLTFALIGRVAPVVLLAAPPVPAPP